jgi:hypothetical protein
MLSFSYFFCVALDATTGLMREFITFIKDNICLDVLVEILTIEMNVIFTLLVY